MPEADEFQTRSPASLNPFRIGDTVIVPNGEEGTVVDDLLVASGDGQRLYAVTVGAKTYEYTASDLKPAR